MADFIRLIVAVYFTAGLICLLLPGRTRGLIWALALAVSLAGFLSFVLIFQQRLSYCSAFLLWDGLSAVVALGISFFGLVISVASLSTIPSATNQYYGYLLWTLGAGVAAVVANHFLLLVVFWGFLAITLYLMINLAGPQAAYPAKKTLIIVGGSDSFLLLGLCLLYVLTGKLSFSEINYQIHSWQGAAAFLCLTVAAFAKAGAMPFHTWIPEISETAWVPVMAFLPASLDKLLGIYLLARVCLHLFSFHPSLWLLLRLAGAVTVVAAVFMALVQHNMKKLLAYHAVSQVGYMVLGVATGTTVGVLGGLFHMINHAVYKCCLFLGAGAVERQTGTSQLDDLGGLARKMPVTFVTFLLASLAISGVPPLNGFFSKWMVYQGLVEAGRSGQTDWVVWLVMAMIGSALTLASFLKIIHSVFLGRTTNQQVNEAPSSLRLALVTLALICVVFGLFYLPVPVSRLLGPATGVPAPALSLSEPLIFIVWGLFLGILIFFLSLLSKKRYAAVFVGGEKLSQQMHVSGTEFYQGVKQLPFLRRMYAGAEKRVFDVYEVGKQIVGYVTELFRAAHSGVLGAYLSWLLFGLLVVLSLFLRV
ncbi:MAG TPA: proton-conducting transporter membrane subunit [bacterium]|nr:proton-conducting transporter membrane subunit [bacterium]